MCAGAGGGDGGSWRGGGEVEAGLTKRKKCKRRSCGVIEGRGVGARRQEQEMSSSDEASETMVVVVVMVVGRQQQTARLPGLPGNLLVENVFSVTCQSVPLSCR